jgi:hypothetical protein
MPFPLFAIAIPVLHSSGAWIASTAASGYIAGTLSGTWVGAFVLGNSTMLASLGLVSAAGVYGAASASSASMGVGGSILAAIGLGGTASALEIAPVVTFLGLTPVGWAVAGTATTLAATVGYYFKQKIMKRLNDEREKGGLEPITIAQIIQEVRLLEAKSLETILERLSAEKGNISLSANRSEVLIDGTIFSISRLKYIVNKNGSEELVFVTKTGRKRRLLLVKDSTMATGNPA